MGLFDDSDKKSGYTNWLDLSDLELLDLSKNLNTSLKPDSMVFGKFSRDEIIQIMEEAELLQIIRERGYPDYKIEINIFSDLDNRIFIKTSDDKVLVHMRLKYSDFNLKKTSDRFRMVYIDWLLTQNVRFLPGTYKKQLFFGQEYPGLGIFVEITKFIQILTKRLGAHGVFNIPEYFHDAVLFRDKFRYIDPSKEGQFRALLSMGRKYRIRELSEAIHSQKLEWLDKREPFQWFYGEMLTAIDPYLENTVFDETYYGIVSQVKESSKFRLVA